MTRTRPAACILPAAAFAAAFALAPSAATAHCTVHEHKNFGGRIGYMLPGEKLTRFSLEKLGLLHRISSVRLSKGCYLRYVGRIGAPIIRKRWGHIWKTDRNLAGAANNQNKFQEVRCHCNAIRGRNCQLYERDNFVGQAVTINRGRKANTRDFKYTKTGMNLSARRTMDNIATSAYVPRGCRMIVTDKRDRKGRQLILREGLYARLPRGWNDRISWAGCSCIR